MTPDQSPVCFMLHVYLFAIILRFGTPNSHFLLLFLSIRVGAGSGWRSGSLVALVLVMTSVSARQEFLERTQIM